MAYALFSRSFESGLRNSVVTISNKWTGVPAVILESPLGGILSTQGVAVLDDEANLNVYIDTAEEWTVKVLDGQVLEYNVLDPKKIVTVSDLDRIVPEIGVTYVLNKPPYTEYIWDGVNLISGLNATQTALVQNLSDSEISNVAYDGQGRMISYRRSGVDHTVTYPDAFTCIFSNTTGASKTVTLDSNGRVSSIF